MLITIPGKVVEFQDEMRRKINALLYDIALRENIRYSFVTDSKCIQEGIDDIVERLSDLKFYTENREPEKQLKDTLKSFKELEDLEIEDKIKKRRKK